MLELKYHSWKEIPLKKYYKVYDILTDKGMSDEDKTFELIAQLCDKDIDDIYNAPLKEFESINGQLSFLSVPYEREDKEKELKKITVGDIKCKIVNKMDDFTVSQYVDFQNYIKMGKEYTAHLLSTFVIPEGKTYNKDYNLDEFIEKIENNISMAEANILCFFFVKRLTTSISHTLFSLGLMMKMTRVPKEAKSKKKEALKNLKTLRKGYKTMFGFHL